jgi:hypothetical protein
MPALRPRNVIATFLRLIGASPKARALDTGPGCTCESCVQAWDRHHPKRSEEKRERRRRLRPGLY